LLLPPLLLLLLLLVVVIFVVLVVAAAEPLHNHTAAYKLPVHHPQRRSNNMLACIALWLARHYHRHGARYCAEVTSSSTSASWHGMLLLVLPGGR
jgi:hypothetical protein